MATDMGRVTEVKDIYGTILTMDDEIRDTWPCHFDGPLTVKMRENRIIIIRRDSTSTGNNTRNTYIEEVTTQLGQMSRHLEMKERYG